MGDLPIVLGSWFALQYFYSRGAAMTAGSGVAYLAHVAGFVFGVLVLLVMRRRLAPRRFATYGRRPSWPTARAVLLVAALAWSPVVGTGGADAAPACVPSALPMTALQQMADGLPLGGKKVGAGWDMVVLGTVTEVRHKLPQYRYRITLHVDSALGGDLPALYTFFGSSTATFPFETGKVYAVPLARRGAPGPLLPTTELWANACDPVVSISDLAAAHEVIARTKPGYTPPPAPEASPSPTDTQDAAPHSATPEVSGPASTAAVKAPRLTFPDQHALGRGIRRGIYTIGGLALVIALIAAGESWWSRRHFV